LRERWEQGVHNARKLLDEIRGRGYAGGYSQLKLAVARWREEERERAFVRFETGPGEQSQMDWGHFGNWDGRRLYGFALTMCYSRMRYVEFTQRQDIHHLLSAMVHAFRYFGGVTECILTDRMKTVLLDQNGGELHFHKKFLDFAAYYGFVPRVCRPYQPETKGKIEFDHRLCAPRSPERAFALHDILTAMLRTLILLACLQSLSAQPAAYFPARNDWQRSDPAAAGMDQAKIDEAIAWHRAHENKNPRDLRRSHDLSFAREAYGDPLGPFQPRGEPTGVIVRHGHIVAEWGEPLRADMTFSVTKSFLSSVVGLAYDHGLIRDLNDPVKDYVPGEYFASDHNSRITWDHLLRQTSDWEGTLWGKPDWADRPPKDIPFEQ